MGKILDISKYQTKVDYQRLKGEVDYVVLRSSNGTQKHDELLDIHLKGVIGAGISFGLYHYALFQGGQDTLNEANMLIKAIEKAKIYGKKPSYVFVDVEEKHCADIVKETNRFIQEVEKKTGTKCGLYSGDAFVKQYGLLKVTTAMRWIARYGLNDGKVNNHYQPTTSFHIWQYTSKGQLPSISGNLDLSTCSTVVLNQLKGNKQIVAQSNSSNIHYKNKKVVSKVANLRFYNKPSWIDKDVAGTVNKGIGFPTIVEKIKVGDAYQYKVKNSKGATFYITASDKYVELKNK
ncbi:hypothetical protein H8530_002670 [Listeria monocytogenes]|nr:hypothetical protein [Listeria monocytogenes]